MHHLLIEQAPFVSLLWPASALGLAVLLRAVAQAAQERLWSARQRTGTATRPCATDGSLGCARSDSARWPFQCNAE
ncbi:hypothetical protein ULF88_13030 [Halopseudomonas pachastrellae]|nr:hypothetical protein [Halopseudomonas pachastrellae]